MRNSDNPSPAKVLILNPYFPTLGGGEKYMAHLCQFFEDYYEAVSVDVLVANYNQITVSDPNYPRIDELNAKFGVHLKSTRLLKKNTVEPAELSDLSRSYDVFVNHMYWSRLPGHAKVNLYLCMFPPMLHDSEAWYLRFLDGWRRSNRFLSSYHQIIAISDYTNHWLHHFWKAKFKKSCIIPPPVYWLSEETGRYVEPQKRNVILAVGRFFVGGHSKQQEAMVRFFIKNEERFTGYELHLAGGVAPYGPDKELVDRLTALAKSHRVVFHFNASPAELDGLYREAKIFWHATGYGVDADLAPDRMEHFGITTVEAMTYGAVPVVIGKGGQPEILDGQAVGFLWNNEEEWFQATQRLIDNEDLRRQMAGRGPERARFYSSENFLKKCQEQLSPLLKNHQKKRIEPTQEKV